MEAQIGGEARLFYGSGAPEKGLMQSREWDLNDWKWDGNLFIASALNSIPADCRSKQLFPVGSGIPESFPGNGSRCNGTSSSYLEEVNGDTGRESEKRRRVLMVEEDEFNVEEAGSLTLKLGENVYPVLETMDLASWDGKNGKKMKLQVGSLNRSICQVDYCGADLNGAKDYHKRHKVCEMHSKATKALVGNVMQRFCQQCSRFHVLQEFDEGKRSCRRRLAGHNSRRRKTHRDSIICRNPLNDERASGYLLISLLRILSNLHSNSSEVTKNQDLLSHLLRNLASFAGTFDGTGLSKLLQTSQDVQSIGPSVAASLEKVPTLLSDAVNCAAALEHSRPSSLVGMPEKGLVTDNSARETFQTVPSQNFNGLPGKARASCSLEPMLQQGYTVERVKSNNFDLNSIYYESQDCIVETGSLGCPWVINDSDQSSPPQTSGNSDSASAESPSSSNGDFQSRTDRIVFKLFGKDPNDFPLVLRGQILDWLSHCPTDIESYIRPGCIILTIYLRLAESKWEELCCGLRSSLKRLLDVSDDVFWRSGWIYARVQHRIAFIYNGQVVSDSSLHWRSQYRSKIFSVKPIAVPVSEKADFTVKGFNLSRSTTKLLCAFDGKYLVQETSDLGTDMFKDYQHYQTLSFFCTLPNLTGRGFIEVEDHDLSTGFFPFIVAEQDVCTEIRVLESLIEEVMESNEEMSKKTEHIRAKNQALEFLQEMGWLLQRSRLYKSRSNGLDSCLSLFPNTRFKWLLDFSMDRSWCAVVKKLLDILFDGNVDVGAYPSLDLMLSEMGLLHGAARRKSRPMVEFLLRYAPDKKTSEKTTTQQNQRGQEIFSNFMFRPDEIGPSGVTPLHIVASSDGAEDVLDALTDDPRLVGIEAWKNSKDKTGFTPEDYAHQRGYNHYIQLVQTKIDNKSATGHVTLNIPGILLAPNKTQKQMGTFTQEKCLESCKLPGLQIEKRRGKPIEQNCTLCDQQLRNRKVNGLLYRPAVLSMVAIAAVCVCVALIFKGPPEVVFVFPFRWELLGYGPI